MPHHLRRARRVSLLALAALATCVCLLSPATASANVRASLQSTVGEEPATGPLQEPTTETPAGESSPETRREERRKRREERRAQHRERRASRNLTTETGCNVTLQATPAIITAAAPLSLVGTLSCPEASSAADQTVTLYQMLARSGGFYIAATTTTEANGTFQFSPTELAVNSSFYVSADGAQSESTSVKVIPQVTIATPLAGAQLIAASGRATRADANAENANAVTFTGTVIPANAGTSVALQREDGNGAWSRIGGGEVNAEGQYSIAHTFYRPGRANIRVIVHSHGLDMTVVSAPVTYQISRRRNRLLTIQASADPISYGLALTITGTVAGAHDAPVTLSAQTGDGPFVKVAETVTTGDEYSFTQSPLQSTRYRVSTATASSAILVEGVAFALTATPSASTVQAGEQLTFSGTVTPSHEGQPVDLEAQNASGIGYHVIAAGAVSSTSAYSIAHTFASAGTALLRIHVPASDEIQSATSETLKIEVTPAP
jgi:plastocyanin